MYREIEQIIFIKRMVKAEIAARLGMSYNTFLLKLKGKYDFSLDEALNLKRLLKTEKSIEELFVKTND